MFGKKKVESIEKKDDKKLREHDASFFALEVRGNSGKKIDKTRNLRCLHRRDISFPNDEQVQIHVHLVYTFSTHALLD